MPDLSMPRLALCLLMTACFTLGAAAQTPPQTAPANPQPRITAAQAKALFASVDTILKFDAQDTGLPIEHPVKRRLLSREQMVALLRRQMDQSKDTARIEQSAVVMEKFGLLPPHFALRDILLKLLGEQVAGFYDSKTKTVNLLDWLDADQQKPVLAHELTHALQDQFVSRHGTSLDKWENAGPDGTAETWAQDREHVRYDETDTAREAVLEGQAMVTYLDWGLRDRGQSLRTLPMLNPADLEQAATGKDADSPLLASAPLVLREQLLFPYDFGLVFEQHLLKDHGRDAAFADVLTHPPDTSYEILHPEFYEHGGKAPMLAMPDLHPLLDRDWRPYDVGVMGALDVQMLCAQLDDAGAGDDAELAWDGGLYYAAQSRAASAAAEQDSTAALALVYLSRWKTEKAAAVFAQIYRKSLHARYAGVVPFGAAQPTTPLRTIDETPEGPALVEQSGRYVFLSQTLPVPLAEQVMQTMLQAQTTPATTAARQSAMHTLNGPLAAFLAQQGTLRAAAPKVY